MPDGQAQHDHWVDVSIAAKIARRHPSTIIRWWKVEGLIRGRQPGIHGKIQIERGSLMRMLEQAEDVR